MTLPIIHINGYPGMGKLTIARKLVELLSPYNGRLVHNHLLIDPVGAILPRSSPDYQPARHAVRSVIFDALAVSQDTADSVFVFTDFQSNDEIGRGVIAEYRNMTARRGCTFVPVTVTCNEEENLRRLASIERVVHGKLTDATVVAHLRENAVVHQWPKEDPCHMELDITKLNADEAAHAIFEHVLAVCKELSNH
ncbi:uncharacterized protein B0J16DRAFT_325905 [Fusarium flagelliforme]|uniref:Aaa atpase family protein n=1 Tax=Fusarium flagelliforme TaxID=2675880 RepID=A0A395MC94_9HYPO|nr:uncharacterized protein B0J16DRAFT_325905 [Fusarium flagelliforme]KAH7196388.1 hypothetical protein B0J16DRAFT_325905 [Fusarium flagelliforme]RFN45430.1 aaa atpase family protein [Fusarium flagelliforme]